MNGGEGYRGGGGGRGHVGGGQVGRSEKDKWREIQRKCVQLGKRIKKGRERTEENRRG